MLNSQSLRLSLLCFVSARVPAAAADYPTRAIKMVVPFAPGGGTDVLGRIIGQRLSEQWGQPVVVENQPGASGGIGTRAAAKAEPDGYTLLMASTGALMAASAALAPDGEFDVNKFFAPITVVAAPPYLIVINPNVQANSIAELIKLAREKPKALSFGSSGIGAASHLSGALFEKDAKIEMLHVPYKGTGPAVTDLLGGRIDMMFSPSTTVQALIDGGKLKALATTGAKRSKFFPKVPTVAEERTARLLLGRLVRPAGAGQYAEGHRRQTQQGGGRDHGDAGRHRAHGQARRRTGAADARRVRPLHQCRRGEMGRAGERAEHHIAGGGEVAITPASGSAPCPWAPCSPSARRGARRWFRTSA